MPARDVVWERFDADCTREGFRIEQGVINGSSCCGMSRVSVAFRPQNGATTIANNGKGTAQREPSH
jgi:hypothetical protein